MHAFTISLQPLKMYYPTSNSARFCSGIFPKYKNSVQRFCTFDSDHSSAVNHLLQYYVMCTSDQSPLYPLDSLGSSDWQLTGLWRRILLSQTTTPLRATHQNPRHYLRGGCTTPYNCYNCVKRLSFFYLTSQFSPKNRSKMFFWAHFPSWRLRTLIARIRFCAFW